MKEKFKKEWEKAEVETVEFNAEDIITDSSEEIRFPEVPTP